MFKKNEDVFELKRIVQQKDTQIVTMQNEIAMLRKSLEQAHFQAREQ